MGGNSGGVGGNSGGVGGNSGGAAHEGALRIVLQASDELANRVALRWSVVGTGPVEGFELKRDGVTLARFSADVRSYDDPTAEPGSWSAPSALVASEGTRADAVELSWSGSTAAHRAYGYQLFALSGGQSNVALGSRAVPDLLGYDVSRDGGASWEEQGLETRYLDVAAPLGTLSATTEALSRTERDYVRLSVTSAPTWEPEVALYGVRARSVSGASVASELVPGYRGLGDAISYQWQGSSADSDTDYADLSEVTGAIWFTSAKVDQGRYYRARLSAPGARGFSRGERAELSGFTRLSAGAFQTCGQRENGTVSCWGEELGPGDIALESFSAAPGGGCGLRADGRRICWGNSTNGKSILPHEPSLISFRSVSAGLNAGCGILLDDSLTCWGVGSALDPPAGHFKSLKVGREHACAIDTDDRVQCWGRNDYGQAPAGPSADQFKSVVASWGDHSCGIRLDDTVRCWGRNDVGQAPSEASQTAFRTISASVYATCGIRSDGKLVCWGRDYEGHAPSGPSEEQFFDVAMGYYHTCVLRVDGGVRCWGDDSYAQIPYVPPTAMFRSVAVATAETAPHACGIRQDGKLVCWGENDMGQAPPGPSEDEYVQVDAGFWKTCALRSDGKLACWGYRRDFEPPDLPPASAGEGYASLSVGRGKTCVCGPSAQTLCWAAESSSGLPSPARTISATYHACALDLEGHLACEEYDDPQGYRPPPSDEQFLAVSVGGFHTCAVRLDHSLACWGKLGGGSGAAPEWPSGTFQSIDSASETLCGVQMDGRLVCREAYREALPSKSLDSFRSVSVGDHHFCAVREDGRVLCLGEREGM